MRDHVLVAYIHTNSDALVSGNAFVPSCIKRHLTAFLCHPCVIHWLFHLHMLLGKTKSAVQTEIRWILCPYIMQISFSSLSFDVPVLKSLLLSRRALGGVWSKTFSWFDSLFFLSSIFLFISAASDHYLIGNNITVAVLGIVIPIGEYCWLPHCVVFAFCLPASPSSLLQVCLTACCVRFVVNVSACEYEVMCLCACAWVLGCLRFHLAD